MEPSIQNPFRETLPAPLRLKEDRTALLIVDMQYFDAHPDWGEGRTAQTLGVLDAFDEYFEILGAVIPRIQSLLAMCRGKGIEIIHIRVAELTDDSRDVGWKQVVRGLAVPKGSKEAQLLEEVAPADDEIVVSKSSSGAFATTNLDRILRNLGLTTLLFTGTSTGGCVESTARDALDLGYDVVIVSDACADSTAQAHLTALGRMRAAGAGVASTGEVRSALERLPAVDRQARSGVARADQCVPKAIPQSASRRSPYSLIFPPALELGFDPARSALILVDVTNATCDPDEGLGLRAREFGRRAASSYYARVEAAISNLRSLVEEGRAAGVLIVHVRTAAHTPDGRDVSPKLRSYGFVPVIGSRGADVVEDVAPQPGDIVLSKPASGVCTGTGLDELLRNAGIDTVILAGVSFDGAIEGSVRSLTDRGYGLFLVPDACATYDEQLQEGLWRMQTGIINVVSTAEITRRIAATRAVKSGTSG